MYYIYSKMWLLLYLPCRKEFEITLYCFLFSLLITRNPLSMSLKAKQSISNYNHVPDTVSTHITKKTRKNFVAKRCLKIQPCYIHEQCKQLVVLMEGKQIPLHRVRCQHRMICGVCNFFSAKILELAEYPAEKKQDVSSYSCVLARTINTKECNVM